MAININQPGLGSVKAMGRSELGGLFSNEKGAQSESVFLPNIRGVPNIVYIVFITIYVLISFNFHVGKYIHYTMV